MSLNQLLQVAPPQQEQPGLLNSILVDESWVFMLMFEAMLLVSLYPETAWSAVARCSATAWSEFTFPVFFCFSALGKVLIYFEELSSLLGSLPRFICRFGGFMSEFFMDCLDENLDKTAFEMSSSK